jgi:hypothetical protein
VKGLFLFSALFLGSLSSCKKASTSTPLTGQTGLYTEWTWIGSFAGNSHILPSRDTLVTLKLNPDNSYITAINGHIFMQGTYTITGSAGAEMLHFNNLPQTIYDTSAPGPGLIVYGHQQIGKLILFVDQGIYIENDTLSFTRHPINPFAYFSSFKR